jgi:hypothetical protein
MEETGLIFNARCEINRMERPIYIRVSRFVGHLLIATLGGTMVGLLLLEPFTAISPSTLHRPLYQILFGLYSPVLWVPSVLLGLAVNAFWPVRASRYVGVFCTVCFVVMIAASWPGYDKSYAHRAHGSFWADTNDELFSLSDSNCADEECLGKLFFTMPLLCSIAYSGGAWLAWRSGKIKEEDPKSDEITLNLTGH